MKERRKGMIILIVVLAALLVLFFIFYGDEKHYQWYEGYRANSPQPYGTMFMQQLLEHYRPGADFTLNKKPISEALAKVAEPAKTDYIFIGQNIFLNDEGREALTTFIERGGDVFIASIRLPEEVLEDVYFPECDSAISMHANFQRSVNMNFIADTLRTTSGFDYAFRFMTEDVSYQWNYFSNGAFCDSAYAVAPLGFQDDGRVNFVRIAIGEGNLYLHANPLVFTNYFLVDRKKLNYVSGVFSYLDGRDIIWDEYSKLPFLGNSNAYNSPLYYIMSQPALKYAWWLMLLTVLLYVVFAAKRKQRVIPVIEGKRNTSLEFVNVISQLHYKNGNHLDMAHKKMKYFLYFVRSRYGIHAEKYEETHIHRLAEKSRVPLDEVEVIFARYRLIEERFRNNIEANRLVDLFDAIENFYKQCK